MSTFMYQLEHYQAKIMETARKILKPDGVVVIQDFAQKNLDPSRLDFQGSWFNTPYTYRTFVYGAVTDWKMMEALQWKNGRCTEVRAGQDFGKIFQSS